MNIDNRERGRNDDQNNKAWQIIPAVLLLSMCFVIVGVFIFSMIFLT